MNDFETVRWGGLDSIKRAALDRIEAEGERLRAIIDGSAPTSPIGVQRAILKENERLRAELNEKKGELAVAYGGGTTEPEREWFSALDKAKAEVALLTKERDDARVQRDTALTTLELSQAEVEQLRETFIHAANVENRQLHDEIERLLEEVQDNRDGWMEEQAKVERLQKREAGQANLKPGGMYYSNYVQALTEENKALRESLNLHHMRLPCTICGM